MDVDYSVFRAMPCLPFDATLIEQVDLVLAYHLEATGRRINERAAIRYLDRIRADYRAMRSRERTGFGLQCPFCFGLEEDLRLDLNDPSRVECFRCNESFSPHKALSEIAEMMGPWEGLIRWIDGVRAMHAEVARPVPVAAAS